MTNLYSNSNEAFEAAFSNIHTFFKNTCTKYLWVRSMFIFWFEESSRAISQNSNVALNHHISVSLRISMPVAFMLFLFLTETFENQFRSDHVFPPINCTMYIDAVASHTPRRDRALLVFHWTNRNCEMRRMKCEWERKVCAIFWVWWIERKCAASSPRWAIEQIPFARTE